jgi:diaminopimelate epimerase
MLLPFTKMHGAGNDFVVIDATRQPLVLSRAQLRKLGDRHLGVGADQILVVERASDPSVDFNYRIFNGASGDEVEHCGNGARCFLRFVRDQGLTTKTRVRVRTVNNVLELVMHEAGRVSVDMNVPRFEASSLPFDAAGLPSRAVGAMTVYTLDDLDAPVDVAVLSVGNPHAVTVVADVKAAMVQTQGPRIERHRRFTKGVNVGFMQVLTRKEIALRVWERDAGETLACGTGACAAAVVGMQMGLLDARVDVHTHGGLLTIEWPGSALGVAGSMTMTGPTETVYRGDISL